MDDNSIKQKEHAYIKMINIKCYIFCCLEFIRLSS